jgi:hypothetical protein
MLITLLNLHVSRMEARSNGHPDYLQRILNSISATSLVRAINTALLFATTVLVMLSSTHVGTSIGQLCTLQARWQALYRQKDAGSITQLQDLLQCCGFKSSRDMEWPFPDRSHGADACEARFERHMGCADRWEEKQRTVALLMVLVAIGVGLLLMLTCDIGVFVGGEKDQGRITLGSVVEDFDDGNGTDEVHVDVEAGTARRITYRDEPRNKDERHEPGSIQESADGCAETTSLLDGGRKWKEPAEESQ